MISGRRGEGPRPRSRRSVVLAGDIGGTNTRLAFFEVERQRLHLVSEAVFPSRSYQKLQQIIREFASSQSYRAEAACFGIAGPVNKGVVQTPNLPWTVVAAAIADEIGLTSIQLLNDLEANAYGIALLSAADTICINPGLSEPTRNRAVISAGTGLGEAGLFWTGQKHLVCASEGGHGDFAPRNDLEIELLCYLKRVFQHVSYERVLSGPGLVNIYSFLRDTGRAEEPEWLRLEMQISNPAAIISRAALAGKNVLCEQALDLFVSIYGAEAGNLGLRFMATDGVFLGGGIAPKIAPRLASAVFMESFTAKGRMSSLLQAMPVYIITNEKTALLGAALVAARSILNM
jgi:glucokinase